MANAPHQTHNLYRSAVTLATLQVCHELTRGVIDDFLSAVEAKHAFPPELMSPEYRPLRKKRVKDSLRRFKDATGERLMVALVEPVNGQRAWMWFRNDTLQRRHYLWLIETKLIHARRETYAVNRLIEKGSQRYPSLNGRVFELHERQLPS
jgi:hypothetical protein